jgi:hypothetical protein
MIEIKCQKLFGFIPDDLRINFKPLRILSAEQEENVKTQKFTRLLQAKQAGEVTRHEFREGCNKGNLLDITLDNAGDQLNPDDPDIADTLSGQDLVDGPAPGAGEDSEDNESAELKAPAKGSGAANRMKGKRTAPEAKIPNSKTKTGSNANLLPPFSPLQALERGQSVKIGNSGMFDRASYAADGGDGWVDYRREEFFKNPLDKALFKKAEEAAEAAGLKGKWQFKVWWYLKHGGKFNAV